MGLIELNRENAFVRLAGLLASRSAEEYGGETDPSSVAAVLTRVSEIEPDKAEALAWGRVVDVTPQANERLAEALSLHPGLLGCVLMPSSWEGIEHGLREAQKSFCSHECGVCDLVSERTFMLEEGVDPLEVCLDALEHLRVGRPEEGEAEPVAEAVDVDRLEAIMNVLPEASRLRVMAFAYQELAEVTSGQPLGQFAAYARLRRDYLTPLSRALLDHLAYSPEGELSAAELQARLSIDARDLSHLTRSVARSLARLAKDGHALNESPLELRRPTPRDRRLRLRPRALSAWRALLRAEEEAVVEDYRNRAA